ncbi:unnamed protein product [Caenorhabditis brenneri]
MGLSPDPPILEELDLPFTFEMGDATYIATTETHYKLYSNGSSIPVYKDVPRSDHFLFQGPANSYIELNTNPVTRINGRHAEIRIQSVNLLDIIPHMSHEDLDEYDRITMEEKALNFFKPII